MRSGEVVDMVGGLDKAQNYKKIANQIYLPISK